MGNSQTIPHFIYQSMVHKKYSHLVLGGTFDHLHFGHKQFLTEAFALADRVDIAITKNKSLLKNKKLKEQIEAFSVRKTNLINYLKASNYYSNARILPLNDIYGNTLKEKNAQVILVTEETHKNALLINQQRKKIGFPKLDIVVSKIHKDNKKQIISSERIRIGDIDRDGFNYFDVFNKEILTLPEKLRPIFKLPLGKVYHKIPDVKKQPQRMLVAVGDIISQSLINKGIIPDVKIIDYRSRRQYLLDISKKNLSLINEPGTINKQTVKAICKVVKKNLDYGKKSLIEIKGEEDLLVLPVILLAPLGVVVFYGQFELGVVKVEVTEVLKQKVRKILELFI